MYELNYRDFDTKFRRLLKKKKGKNIARSRYDLETIDFKKRISFVISLLEKFAREEHIAILKVQYWEKDEVINQVLEELDISKVQYFSLLSYKNRVKPGEFFIEMKLLEVSIISEFLLRHFNFDLAKEPALNIRVQLWIALSEYDLLFDFYDDRGFDLYWIKKK